MTTTQPEYITNTSDQIVTKIKGTTTANTNITITYAVGDGSASYFNTPLPLRASQVRFNSTTNISSTNVQTAIEELDSETVKLTGDQTVLGVKTYSSSPIVPTPTTDLQASTKEYVDVGLASKSPTASPTFTGTVTLPKTVLGETSLQLDPALSADGTWSGITETGTAGATLAFGQLCYFQASDSRWELADANLSAGYDKKLGICILAASGD